MVVPPFVYKAKKGKNYGFLDFTTVEKRREFCRREVNLNRRFSPEIYMGVSTLLEENGRFYIVDEDREGGREYLVKMRYLPEEGFLSNLLSREETPVLQKILSTIGKKLGEFYPFHRAEEKDLTTPEAVFQNIEENFTQVEPHIRPPFNILWVKACSRFSHWFYTIFYEYLKERSGFFVEGHGDLHTQQIHWEKETGKVSILDGIEFNDRFRILDPVNDLAFLIMDLHGRGRYDLALFFCTEALSSLPSNPTHSLVLPFYLSYRAFVRGKVNLFMTLSPELKEEERSEALSLSLRYFQLATQYALFGLTPTVLAFCGVSGSGKSTLAKQIASLLGTERHASDRIRKALAGYEPQTITGSPIGGGIYTPEMTERTYRVLAEKGVESALKTGIGIVDGTFLKEPLRQILRKKAKKMGVSLIWLILDEEKGYLERRVESRTPGESEAGLEVFYDQWEKFTPPLPQPGEKTLYLSSQGSVEYILYALIHSHLSHLASSLPPLKHTTVP